MLTLSLLLTVGLGLYFASFPSYSISLAIHAVWGITITLLFWGAMIRVTRNWAPPSEQGKAFGILETGRGFGEVLSSMAFLAVFAMRGIYIALLEEGGIPMVVTGTAAGFILVIGFTPDIFMPLLGGVLLDRFPGAEGYELFFFAVAGICAVGLTATLLLHRRIAANR